MNHILQIDRLFLQRGPSFQLDIAAMRVTGGTMLGIAGPNGSGKTTLAACLAGLLAAPGIRVSIDGQKVGANLRATKAQIGYIPDDEHWFIKELCAREYFALLASVYAEAGVPRQKLEYRLRSLASGLTFTAFEQPLESLSHGNKKKVQIIAGLMHQPSLLILDELRNGLDPMAIIAAEELIRAECRRGACVVVATHDLWWIERMADETVMLWDGRVVVHQKTMDLLGEFGSLEKLFIRLLTRDKDRHAAV